MEGHDWLDVEVLGNTATFGDAIARSSLAVVALVSGALELFFSVHVPSAVAVSI